MKGESKENREGRKGRIEIARKEGRKEGREDSRQGREKGRSMRNAHHTIDDI